MLGVASDAHAQQCTASKQCGGICCQNTEVCHLGACIPLGTRCTASHQCKSTEYCETKLGYCFSRQGASLACEYKPPTGNFKPNLLWEWKPSFTTTYHQTMMTPVVMALEDTNGDKKVDDKDIPYVAIVSMERYFGNGRGKGAVRIFRGTDGRLMYTAGLGVVHGWSSLALGDVDGNGIPEIVAQRYNTATGLAQGLIAFEISTTGSVVTKWITRNTSGAIAPTFTPTTTYYGAPVITDMDGDGKIEVISGGHIFRGADGRLLCSAQTSAQASYTIDIDGDGKLELVTGANAYSKTCVRKWNSNGPNAISAAADLDGDGKPEIVTAGSSVVTVLNGQTGATITSIRLTGDTGGKGPVLGDVDGDTYPEIGVSARDYYHMFKYNRTTKQLSLMWRIKSRDYSSSGVSSSMFDFNFDGKIAVVFNDEIASHIVNGLTGGILLKDTTHRSGTVMEYPIVVDVDGDGRAETVSATNLSAGIGRVRVVREIGYNWVNTRPVWNQYQYNVTNICTGDKFCPPGSKFGQPATKPFDNWKVKGLNNFRVNNYGGHSDMNYQDSPFSIPDLAIGGLQTQWKNCSTNQLEVIFQVRNLGSLRTKAGVPVTVYQGNATTKTKLVTVTTSRTLLPGASEYFAVTVTPALARQLSLYVVADDNGAGVSNRRECNENNNSASKTFLPPTTDPYCIGLVNDPPTITGTPPTTATQDATYAFSPGVTDPDPLNTHTWRKVAGPTNATVDPKTGKVSWTPGANDAGKTVTITIEVCDDGTPKLCARKTWSVKVNPATNPPQIVGTPSGSGSTNQGYGYQPRVVDPDAGDTHTWKGKTLPPGASVDPSTGEVKWTPKAADAGKEFTFAIEVCDQTGLCATQTWRVRVDSKNQLPQIVGTPAVTADANANYAYRPGVRDPDTGDTHTWKLNSGPAGATIDPKTGAIDWIPGPGDVGKEFTFSITVCDSANQCATQAWLVRVKTPANTPPQIGGTPATNATPGTPYQHNPTVIDPDVGDTHTWTLEQAPPGAKIDPTTGKITWTPGPGDAGKEVEFAIKVCDKGGECALQLWRVQVADGNSPPLITSTPPVTAETGKDYKYPAKVSDNDAGDTHTWKLRNGPAGAKIDAKTGEVTWKPSTNDDKTTPTFEIEVCDKAGNCARQSWQVRVGATGNQPPNISGIPATKGDAGKSYAYSPKVVDPDAGDTHTWKLKAGPTGAKVDPKTGKLEWTPGPGDQGKTVEFAIEVCDDKGACATQRWSVKVGANNPPQIDGAPKTTGTPGTPYAYSPKVIDPDAGDTHTWKGKTLPPGASVDPKTGQLTWTPRPEDAGKIFDFEVEVCDDKGACATRKWRVKVDGKPNTPPAITGTPSNDGIANSAYTFSPGVSDPDPGDTHTWKKKSGPTSANVDPNTGKVTWTPGSSDVGKDVEIEIEVCDKAGACATRKWNIRVSANGKPPQMVGAPATQAKANVPYTFKPSLKDPNPNETYKWALKEGPPGAKVDPKTGQLDWTPKPEDVGKIFDFEIEVCDSQNRCAKRRWKVRVTSSDVNAPPVITSTPPTTGTEGVGYRYRPTAVDPDVGDVLKWRLTTKPTGASINPNTGEIQWTPGPGDAGKSIAFEVEVCDRKGRCDTQKWIVTVDAKNNPPKITSTPPKESYVGEALTYATTVQDNDANDQHRWRLRKAPPGATIDPKTGKITWTPTASDADRAHEFEVEVCDNGTPRLCDTQTFNVTPRKKCRVDVDCKADQICVKDTKAQLICVPPGCAEKNPKCSTAGNFCLNGSCQPNPCDGKTCNAGEFCRPSDGKCVKPCAGVQCKATERCIDGACIVDPCAAAGTSCKANELCDNSDPTKPTCINNPCSAQSCRHGRACNPEGVCIDDPCPNIKCPDVRQHRCLAGQCVDLKPCAVDIDCPSEDVCIEGKCRESGCYTNLSVCNSGVVCLEAQCKDNQCPTPGGQACAAGEFCRVGDATCTASCGTVNCAAKEKCEDGTCKADPCAGKTCPSGSICVKGDCKKENCVAGTNKCKHGRVCSQLLNVCTDDRCRGVTCPVANEICVEGQCISKDCDFDKDCPNDEICLNNKCVLSTCKSNSDCSKAERCINGKCVPDSCDGKQCPKGEFCRGGQCVPSCAGVFCPGQQICVDGKCIDDPCAGKSCNADETCQNGKCIKDKCKGQQDPCKHGRTCLVDRCGSAPCEGVTCNGQEQCKKGQCTGDRACQVDIDCPGDAVCVGKLCRPSGCYTDKSCGAPKQCVDASCGENPCDNKQCANDEFCRPIDGKCIKSCPRCPNGEICKEGACIKDPCQGVVCRPGGESCVDGKCIVDQCQANTPQCRHGRVCQTNACMDDLCAGVTCPDGQQCRKGICYGDITPPRETNPEPTVEPRDEVAASDAGPDGATKESNGNDNTAKDDNEILIGGGCGCQSTKPSPIPLALFLLCMLLIIRRKHTTPQSK